MGVRRKRFVGSEKRVLFAPTGKRTAISFYVSINIYLYISTLMLSAMSSQSQVCLHLLMGIITHLYTCIYRHTVTHINTHVWLLRGRNGENQATAKPQSLIRITSETMWNQLTWSERVTVNPEVVGSIPAKAQIYMDLSYINPQAKVLNYCYSNKSNHQSRAVVGSWLKTKA